MYNALKTLQISIITLHVGFLIFMLEEEVVSPLKDDGFKSVKTALVCSSMRLVTPAIRGLT